LRVDWPHFVGLPVWIVAVGLLLKKSGVIASGRLGV
jgi:hypothetical protein